MRRRPFDPPESLGRLRRVGRSLRWCGLVGLLLPLLAWLGITLSEGLVPPSAIHLPILLSTILALYLAPVAVVLLALGLAAGAWAWWLGGVEWG